MEGKPKPPTFSSPRLARNREAEQRCAEAGFTLIASSVSSERPTAADHAQIMRELEQPEAPATETKMIGRSRVTLYRGAWRRAQARSRTVRTTRRVAAAVAALAARVRAVVVRRGPSRQARAHAGLRAASGGGGQSSEAAPSPSDPPFLVAYLGAINHQLTIQSNRLRAIGHDTDRLDEFILLLETTLDRVRR